MATSQASKRLLARTVIGLCVVLVFVGGVVFIRSFLGGGHTQQPKVVQEVHLIRPPPPPPPEEKPPPPPPPEEKVVTPQDQPKPEPAPSNQPPPSEHLGLDAEGGAGGDAFGLVGNQGGADLLGGTGGSAIAWYSGVIKSALLEQLSADKDLRKGNYKLEVRLWLRSDGTVDHFSVVQGSGDRDRDRMIEAELSRITRLPNPPPPGYPMPATVTLVSHS
jgi:periplasmic protein TonB